MPLFRFLKVLAQGSRGAPLDPLGESVVRFRVWPNDLDENRHMNNGRYLTLMDLGRWDLMLRAGVVRMARRNGWFAVLSGATVRFRRDLRLLQRFEIRTRIAGWDERAFFLEQRYVRGTETVATAWVRAVFVGREGPLPTARVLEAVGRGGAEAPPLAEGMREWLRAQEALTALAKAGA